jgi:hypothetical protein
VAASLSSEYGLMHLVRNWFRPLWRTAYWYPSPSHLWVATSGSGPPVGSRERMKWGASRAPPRCILSQPPAGFLLASGMSCYTSPPHAQHPWEYHVASASLVVLPLHGPTRHTALSLNHEERGSVPKGPPRTYCRPVDLRITALSISEHSMRRPLCECIPGNSHYRHNSYIPPWLRLPGTQAEVLLLPMLLPCG